MPYDDPDSTDPMTLHGVAVEVDDDGAMRSMAECFVEEFSRVGFSEGELLRLFRDPRYAGPHLAYLTFGEAWIAELIGEHRALRGPCLPAVEAPAVPIADSSPNRVVRLTVLDTQPS
jgi:hypothetical protein